MQLFTGQDNQFDPQMQTDGHVVEVAEPMPLTVKRLAAEGLTPEEIRVKTMLPPEVVAHMLW